MQLVALVILKLNAPCPSTLATATASYCRDVRIDSRPGGCLNVFQGFIRTVTWIAWQCLKIGHDWFYRALYNSPILIIRNHKVFFHSQQNINKYSEICSFGYMFRFHQTFLRPIFIIWRYIQCVGALWDTISFKLIKAKIIPVLKNFNSNLMYGGYSESKYRLRTYFAHPRDCHFAHVQWLPVSIEKPQTPFHEICFMFMFVPVR